MEAVLAHLKEYYVLYGAALLVLAPALYFTRKYSLPIIFYVLETIVYLCMMHTAMWLIVSLTRWFAENSSMRALREDGRPMDTPEWGTPLLNFWQVESYDPHWVVYVEAAAALIIMLLVWRYRPLRIKYKGKKRHFANEGKAGKPAYPNWRNYSSGGDSPKHKD